MQLQNPFKLQNWTFKRFLIVILFFQIALLGLFALNNLGIEIPIIRPLIGFVYLSFVPGYLLLRILRLHNLSSIESFLYALGLSFFIDYLVGFLMNMLYPILGITDKPISEIPIVITMAGVVFLLSVIAYFRDKDYSNPDYIDLKDILNPQVLFLSLIPLMAIFGTYLVNYYHSNILLMIMIVVIALVALIIGFTNWIDEKYYPYGVWAIAIALVWHIMLITPYVNNHDGEMWGAKLTIENGFWNYKVFGNYHSILSSNIFAPIIYFICDISLTWVYKGAFPLWISIFPVVIYTIVRRYLENSKIAFLCSFIVVSFPGFWYAVFPTTTKQFMAEFFISLIVLAISYNNLNKFREILLLISFGICVIWSHYGTSYLFMIGVLFTLVFLKTYDLINNNLNNYINIKKFLSFTWIYTVLLVSWYIYISHSSLFYFIVNIGNNILNSIWSEFLDPNTAGGAYMIVEQVSGLRLISKYMNLGIAFFIVVGILKTLVSYKKLRFDPIYLGLSLFFLGILIASVVVPYFAVMNPHRLYMLSLITLTPFCVIGGIYFFKIIFKVFRSNLKYNNLLKIMYCYITILMLFYTGFIYEIAKDHPFSVALSQNSVEKYGSMKDKVAYYGIKIMGYDVESIQWLSKYYNKNYTLYYSRGCTSTSAIPNNYGGFPYSNFVRLTNNTKYIKSNSYIWLMYVNIKENIGFSVISAVYAYSYYNFSEVKPLLRDKNKIYDNGGSQVLLS